MKQKCPNCGRWCDGEYRNFIQRAERDAFKTADSFANFGERVGGVFGKRGKKIGRFAGAFISGATQATSVKALLGGLSGEEYHFQCSNCGYEWDANADEDQIEDASQDYDGLIAEIQESLNDNDFDNAMTIAEEITALHFGGGMYWLARAKRAKAEHLITKDLSEEELDQRLDEHNQLVESGLKDIEACEQYYLNNEDDPVNLAWAIAEKGMLYTQKSNSQARKWFMVAMQSFDDAVREYAKDGYEYATEKVMYDFNKFVNIEEEVASIFNDNNKSQEEKDELSIFIRQVAENNKFCNREPFSDRQFLFIVKNVDKVAGCYDMDDNINWVFTQDSLPADITFPTGHPMPNTLYIAHPAKKGFYLPFEGAEEAMFLNKVEEFCRLSQCLGAIEISFKYIQGKAISQSSASSYAANADGGRKGMKASGSTVKSDASSSDITSSKEVGLSFTYKPTQSPYCPSDIDWLKVDPSWQTFVKQRLEGNILSYTKRIASSETTNISSSKKRNVKTSFETLMANVESNYDSTLDTTFSNSENTVWEITVKFKSMDEFDNQAITKNDENILCPEEIKYKEDVLLFLEDGLIGEAERKFLERKRIKYGISEDKARQIEESCKPHLTEDENEYLEIFKEMIEEGELSDRKRRMLNREADSLGISSERRKQLESLL